MYNELKWMQKKEFMSEFKLPSQQEPSEALENQKETSERTANFWPET
jgi:hypothetical protein